MSEPLTEAESSALWRAIKRAFLNEWNPASEDDLERVVAAIARARVAEALAPIEALADEWAQKAMAAAEPCPDGLCGACTMGNLSQLLRAALPAPDPTEEGA